MKCPRFFQLNPFPCAAPPLPFFFKNKCVRADHSSTASPAAALQPASAAQKRGGWWLMSSRTTQESCTCTNILGPPFLECVCPLAWLQVWIRVLLTETSFWTPRLDFHPVLDDVIRKRASRASTYFNFGGNGQKLFLHRPFARQPPVGAESSAQENLLNDHGSRRNRLFCNISSCVPMQKSMQILILPSDMPRNHHLTE